MSLLLVTGLQACTRNTPEPVSPSLVAGTQTQDKAMLLTTQKWFAQASQSNPVAINWQQARITDNWLVAPFTNTSNPFAKSQKSGSRFLIAQVPANGVCTGRLVELIVDAQSFTPE